MPPLSATSNKPVAAERKIRRRKRAHPRGQQGPLTSTSSSQPGPISDRENQIINKRKRKPAYRKALRAARVHGPETRRGTGPGEDKSVTPSQQRAIDKGLRDARVRVLRRANRGAGTRALKAELEGSGQLAKVTGALGKRVAPGLAITTRTLEGKPLPIKVGHADFRTPSSRGSTELLKRAGEDLFNLPAQAIPSLYVPVAGLVEAAQGKPDRIKKFAKDFDASDPVYNLAAAVVELAGGDKHAAHDRLKRASDAATAHPGFTIAEALGVKGVVGRGTGALARSRVAPRTIRRIASTDRENATLPGTSLVEPREYSRDVITKAGQVAAAKVKRRVGGHDTERVSDREIRRRVDESVSAAEEIRRGHREQAAKGARKVIKRAKHEQGALSVVAQRITTASRADLEAYVRELRSAYPDLSRAEKRANKQLRQQLQQVIADPHADMARLEATAREYTALVAPSHAKLVEHGLLDDQQAIKSRLIPYAVRNMGARHDPGKGLVDGEGHPLSIAAIREHMGEDDPAFLTQAPNQRGARNFYVPSHRPVTASAGRRTGTATTKGTFDADPETLVEGAAKTQGLVDATENFHRLVSEFSVRGDSGKPKTFADRNRAARAAQNLMYDEHGDPLPNATAMQPIRVNPFGGTKAQLDKLLEQTDNLDAAESTDLLDALSEAARGKDGPGPWALIPKAAADRLLEHLNAQTGGFKTAQLLNQSFRKTVLSTSTSWFAGNMIEGLGRAALARTGLRSAATGRRVLKRVQEISPAQYEQVLARVTSGGHLSSASRLHVRRGAEQFEGTALAPVANWLGKFWRAPGPKQAAGLWHAYTEFVFRSVNGRIESGIQSAMLGAELRRSGLMDGHLLKLSKAAIDDAAHGLLKTENQVKFGRAVDRMYGRYSKLAPWERKMLVTYTPFGMWAKNSAYFVFRTLPRDHPAVTAVIAASENATDEWRNEFGLDLFADHPLAGFLQGTIPLSGGRHQPLARFTPFGAFSDPTATIGTQVLPLWSGVQAALEGRDWKGAKLYVKGANGESRPADPIERLVLASRAFAEATIPMIAQAERVHAEGPSALNPLDPYAPKAASERSTTVRRRKRSEFDSSDGGFFGKRSGGSEFFGNSGRSTAKPEGSGFFGG